MDHLKIQRAHIHGYSMGGSILTQMLARHPERFITAIYGGIRPGRNRSEMAGAGAQGSGAAGGWWRTPAGERWSSYAGYDKVALDAVQKYPWKPEDRAIDLAKVNIPVLALVGSYDQPNARTHRLKRGAEELPARPARRRHARLGTLEPEVQGRPRAVRRRTLTARFRSLSARRRMHGGTARLRSSPKPRSQASDNSPRH